MTIDERDIQADHLTVTVNVEDAMRSLFNILFEEFGDEDPERVATELSKWGGGLYDVWLEFYAEQHSY